MIISGENFRSLAERNEVSFAAEMSLNNTSGLAEFGFSGSGEGLKFQFTDGRMLDPEGRYFNSYLKDSAFTLSGNLETGRYDYYIDGKLNCSIGEKNNIEFNKFFINTSGCSIDIDLNVFGAVQDYSFSHVRGGALGDMILGDIHNNQSEEFTIFSGEVITSAGSFKLDTDAPTGSYDGTYIQDYKYYPGSGDLDECNGRFGPTPDYPSGVYHYHITDNWPYVMSCYKGEPVKQVSNITELVSGTAPGGVPTPWLTGKFFDTQTLVRQSDNVRHYAEGPTASYSDDYIYVTGAGVPQHFYGTAWGLPVVSYQGSANSLEVSQQNHIFKIPINPIQNTVPKPITMEKIGVAIDGVPIDILSNEYYKSRGRWREAVHPNTFNLDKYGAHVQPNGTYHYHAAPSGIICDYDFVTPNLVISDIPQNYLEFSGAGFSKHVDVFGLNVFATSGVSDSKVLHAANVMAEYLDNDLDGVPDNINVANSLVCNQASLIMSSGQIKSKGMSFVDEGVSGVDLSKLSGYHALQELRGSGINPTGVGEFDASLKEISHLLTDHGWSEAYPYTFGMLAGSTLTNYMDSGRGGHYEWCVEHKMLDGATMGGSIHGGNQTCLDWGAVHPVNAFAYGKADNRYPSGSWYHYDNEACDYSCQASRYLYWGVTTVLGAQTGRYEQVSKEWEHVTPTGLQSGDLNFYNLLTNPEYKLPTGYLPTGGYNPSTSVTTYGNTGHSPLIGFAFDGYPIYGSMGYTNPLVSGEVKEMKSSYLPKNVARNPAYPKTIKQNNDLYLPYSVDLISSSIPINAESINLDLILYTNFGDYKYTIPVGGASDPSNPSATNNQQSSSYGTQI